MTMMPSNRDFSATQSYRSYYIKEDHNGIISPNQIIGISEYQPSLPEKLFDSAANCKILFSHLTRYFQEDWRNGIFKQLDHLLDSENWDEEDIPIKPESFRTLLRLLILLKARKRPGFGASYDGNIIANWEIDKNSLTLECYEYDKVRWIVSYQTSNMPEREYAFGSCQIERLQQNLSSYNPKQWFLNGKEA